MKKRISFLLAILFAGMTIQAQSLKVFTENLDPAGKAYLSIKNKKAYTLQDASTVKSALDLALILTATGNNKTLEWYNLKKDNEKISADLTGTATGIVAMTFDKEQFDNCKTTADLTRMTGHITTNSFSHFAVISHSGEVNYHCFLAKMEDGKKALLYVTAVGNNIYQIIVKTQP